MDPISRELQAQLGLRFRTLDNGPALRGTGGAVLAALDVLPEAFWVTYGDTFLQLDVAAAEHRFFDAASPGLMTVLHNRDQWEPSNVRVEDGLVVRYGDLAPGMGEHIDYGMVALRRDAFRGAPAETAFDLGVVFRALAVDRELVAFEVTERFRDIGTPAALRETEDYFRANNTWERLRGGPS